MTVPLHVRPSRRHLRIVVVALLIVTSLSLVHSAATNDRSATENTTESAVNGTLVATIDGMGPGQIVAYGPDGDVVYRNDSLVLYHDVDPSPTGEQTVTYVASGLAPADACDDDSCLHNVVRRVNLSTGEGEQLYELFTGRTGSTQTHDVDHVNESVLLIADISYPDRVFMVNTTTGERIWEWRVSEAYEPESGGNYPRDWTHLNDVEYLDDGRVMISLRNQDQVVFVEPGEGLQENWTLGTDDDHETLYEQHNPDYIPASRGGPAVLVADSENNRIVEYERKDGRWVQTWEWTDERLQWPRDADRLPHGNTLVADSYGDRILSVRPNGSVAWSRPFPDGGYDVEIVEAGDESAGGPSATRIDEEFRMASDESGPSIWLVSWVPPIVLHGLLFALPTWAAPLDAALILGTAVVLALLLLIEGTVVVQRWWRARTAD